MMLTRTEQSMPPKPEQGEARIALKVEELEKSFRAVRAIGKVSFEVPDASMTVLLGAAGAGKTTTLRLIAGLDKPDAGRVLIRGEDVGSLEPKDRDIAMIFDNLALYPNRTGFQNIAHPLALRGYAREEVRTKVDEVAKVLRISHVLNRLPKTLSGGERQRVALGRALIRKPELFLLDEPLSSLDAMLRIELRAELKRLQRDTGGTFLLATPDFAEALSIADTVIMLREGRIVQIASPQRLYDEPADRETARFVGAPEINLAGAAYSPQDGGTVTLAGKSFPAPAALKTAFGSKVRAFEAGIRPEHLTLAAAGEATLNATVTDIEPLGLKSTITVAADNAELRLVAAAAAARPLKAGDKVGLLVDLSRMIAFDNETGRRIG